jgi:cell division protease FtsH
VNSVGKNLLLWLMIIILLLSVVNLFQGSAGQRAAAGVQTIPFSQFLDEVQQGRVAEVTIQESLVKGSYKDAGAAPGFVTELPPNADIVAPLRTANVRISALPKPEEKASFGELLIAWLPMFIIFGVWIFFMRQMQGSSNKAMGFGKSRAKLLTEKTGRITFDDVAGIDEAKVELQEIVEYLKDPHKFQRLGGKIPKGVLLVGPPGTGKTLTARAVAGEANVPFFTISGSDFVEMFVGVGASRVRDMFEQGKKNAPCIIFIDEIDAMGRHRGAGLGGGNDEREQTLNQLLVEMDGFEANEGVILIAATNRPDVLDPALLRPGRFDRQVVVPNPDIGGREKILKVHMRKVPLAPDVDARVIARGTPGFSGADLANLVNEAALMAARNNKKAVGMAEFESAKDKVMMGAERRSMVMTDAEKKLTAYHESGHAIAALHLPESDPIHKATIIPRGRALGMVMRLPEGDRVSMSRAKLKADLIVAMGGRIAEEMIFGHEKVTTGASGDIKMATDVARRMVTEWGMSDRLGPLRYSASEEHVFLGHSVAQQKNMSEETAKLIDSEVKAIVEEAYEGCQKILTDNLDQLHTLANGLLEYETLSGDEIQALLRGETIVRPEDSSPPPAPKVETPAPRPGGRAGSVPTSGGITPEAAG